MVIIHSTNVPGTVLRAECTVVNYTDRELILWSLYSRGRRQQTNNFIMDNFIVDKYSEDNKQDNVNNGRSANLNRMSEETVTISQPHEVIE